MNESPSERPYGASSDVADVVSAILRDPAARALLKRALAGEEQFLQELLGDMDREDLKAAIGYPGRVLPFKRAYTVPPSPFRDVNLGNAALHRLLEHYEFSSVLDVGAGAGLHAKVFTGFGKVVTKLDFGVSRYAQVSEEDGVKSVLADANTVEFEEQFDCVWASHVLEHQPNVGFFLNRLSNWTKDGGIIALTVPSAKFELVGGHLTLWSPGLLIYNLVMSGIDCSDAELLHYGYNITAILRNRRINLPPLHYDSGDVNRLAQFMPKGFRDGVDGYLVARGVGVLEPRVAKRPKKAAAAV